MRRVLGGMLSGMLVVVPLLVGTVAAQEKPDKPDFSGHWVLENATQANGTAPPELTVETTTIRQTARGDPMPPFFATLRVWEDPGLRVVREGTYAIGVRSGRISPASGGGSRTETLVTWEQATLVIHIDDWPKGDSGPRTEHDETWSLDPQGRLRITVTDRDTLAEPVTKTFIFRRR